MVVPGVESDDDLPVPALAEGDAVAVVRVLEEGDDHARQGVAVPEGVRHAVLPPAVDLRDHQDVVEEENLPLVLACRRGWSWQMCDMNQTKEKFS